MNKKFEMQERFQQRYKTQTIKHCQRGEDDICERKRNQTGVHGIFQRQNENNIKMGQRMRRVT